MNKEIVNIINDWNPIEIYPLLDDEYYPEIKELLKIISQNNNISVKELAIEIDNIFIRFFGNDIYISDINKCEEIAAIILKKIL